jgi:hypothetical protein
MKKLIARFAPYRKALVAVGVTAITGAVDTGVLAEFAGDYTASIIAALGVLGVYRVRNTPQR